MDAVNDKLNAVVRRMDEEALVAADAADAARAQGNALGPLHGVPVTIKVNTDQKGHPTVSATPRAISFEPRAIRRATRAEAARAPDPVAATGTQRGSRGTGRHRAPDHAPDPALRTCAHPNLWWNTG